MTRFTALYDAHQRQVYGFAVNRVDPHTADEVVSDTFLVAWRRFDELPEPALPWLLGVARNIIRDRFRRSARQSAVQQQLDAAATTQPGPADPADVVTDRISILTALAQLKADDRELLTLVAWHGLTPAAAAGVVGCSPATYAVRLHRARRRLEQAVRSQTQSAASGDEIPGRIPRKDVSR